MSEAHEEQHERLEREAADLERRSEGLRDDIAAAKQDWEAKKADDSVPGAPVSEGGDDDGDQDAREPWPDE
jgi:hypothetical protein